MQLNSVSAAGSGDDLSGRVCGITTNLTSEQFKVATAWSDDGERQVLSITDEGADIQKSADSSEEYVMNFFEPRTMVVRQTGNPIILLKESVWM